MAVPLWYVNLEFASSRKGCLRMLQYPPHNRINERHLFQTNYPILTFDYQVDKTKVERQNHS